MEKVILSLKVEYIHQVDGDEEDFDKNTEEATLTVFDFESPLDYL